MARRWDIPAPGAAAALWGFAIGTLAVTSTALACNPLGAGTPFADPWTIASSEDGASCVDELKTAGAKVRALPAQSEPEARGCGMPNGVVVTRGPTGIQYDPPLLIDCSLARSLPAVEAIVQEEAAHHLASPIRRIGNLGGFACRARNGQKGAGLSAHAFGLAMDFASFVPAKGKPVTVLRHWAEPKKAEPAKTPSPPRKTREAPTTAKRPPGPSDEDRRAFLHAVLERIRSEVNITYVIGPDYNDRHRDHFHLDRGGWAFWFSAPRAAE